MDQIPKSKRTEQRDMVFQIVQNPSQSPNIAPTRQSIQIVSQIGAPRTMPIILTGAKLPQGHILPPVIPTDIATPSAGDHIQQQNQSAHMFFEKLLRTSCLQLQTDYDNQTWPSATTVQDHNAVEYKDVKMSTTSPLPEAMMSGIKQSTSPQLSSLLKRTRQPTTDFPEVSGRQSVTFDIGGLGLQLKRERSISEGSGESIPTSRLRSSTTSEGGRFSRERSESESDTSDIVAYTTGSVTPDDTRRHMAGSVTPEVSDSAFQPSMLDTVLTQKKMALLRSPEVRKFLQQMQMERSQERHLSQGTAGAGLKADNF